MFDVISVYIYLKRNYPKLDIYLQGDSAGGNLVLSTCSFLLEFQHQINEVFGNIDLPNGIIAISPWVRIRKLIVL